MSEKEIRSAEEAAREIFDLAVNPLANMMCALLAFQVKKGLIEKDDAKKVIAASVDILNESSDNSYIREMGGEMLLRMIANIDEIG